MQHPKQPPKQTSSTTNGRSVLEDRRVLLAGLGLLVVICFFPVTRYFFAQDDFILMSRAVSPAASAMSEAFGDSPGHFRPLTKVLYFRVMYGVFGLNAVPYHVVSLLLHLLNTFLVWLLLRRLGLRDNVALMIAGVFALHVGFINVVLWISCIQQLLAQSFMLVMLIASVRGDGKPGVAGSIVAVLAYVGALMSLEQTVAAPLILLVFVFLRAVGRPMRARLSVALKRTAPLVAVMLAYLAFIVLRKGIPDSGPYGFNVGGNVVSNLLVYLQWVFNVSTVMPLVVDAKSVGFTIVHVLIFLLVIYNTARGRTDIVLLGLSYYMLTILPVLFLQGHTFYIHNYVPAVGMLCLLAAPLEDLEQLIRSWKPRVGRYTGAMFIGLLAVVAFVQVRENERSVVSESIALPNNFVMRRAIVARNVYDDITRKVPRIPPGGDLFLVYKGTEGWLGNNVSAALGRDAGPRLFFEAPGLDVFYYSHGDTLQGVAPGKSVILFYDYLGHCFTQEEQAREAGGGVRQLPD